MLVTTILLLKDIGYLSLQLRVLGLIFDTICDSNNQLGQQKAHINQSICGFHLLMF